MAKNKLSARELVGKYQANCDRIGEIADACEREQRERTEAEDIEYAALMRENQLLQMKMQALSNPSVGAEVSPTVRLREIVNSPNPGGKVSLLLMRDAGSVTLMTTEGLKDTGIIPIDEQEMLKPLRAGLIYDKVGLNIRTGLAAGSLRWPMHTKAVGQFADEGERLTDSKVDFDKLTVSPRRLGIAIPVTKEDLESSQGIVESVIREEMPAAIVDLVNDAMFTTSKTFKDKDGNTKNRVIYGPFVKAAENPFAFAGEVPTRRELLKMKAQVLTAGIKLTHPCWVMTENMKAELEDTKVDVGSGRFLCEGDTILGYPVFTTPTIGEGNIGFGDWSYQAAGFFGSTSLIVDPYTLARQNSTDFVLNGHFATVTLREDAFVLGQSKTAAAESTGEV